MSPETRRLVCHLPLAGFSASLEVLMWPPTFCPCLLSCPSPVPHTVPLFSAWGICAHSVVPPCSSCRDQTGQCFASGNQHHRSELWLPSCTVWKHCLHFDSLDTQRKDPTPTCRQFSHTGRKPCSCMASSKDIRIGQRLQKTHGT